MKREEIYRFVSRIKAERMSTLVFTYLLTDYNPPLPQRVIISERGTWQELVYGLYQGRMSHIPLYGSLAVKNADDLLQRLCIFLWTRVKSSNFRHKGLLLFPEKGYSESVSFLFTFLEWGRTNSGKNSMPGFLPRFIWHKLLQNVYNVLVNTNVKTHTRLRQIW